MAKLTQRDREQMIKDMQRGASDAEVRERYQVSPAQVNYYRRTYNINPVGSGNHRYAKTQPQADQSDVLGIDEDNQEENNETQTVQTTQQAPPKSQEKKYACGNCGTEFNERFKHCPGCGELLAWPQQ